VSSEKKGKPLIYYVEDDTNIRNLTIYALTQVGLKVCGFDSADGFYAALSQADELPQLVLLDIMLPGQNGIEVLRSLRAGPSTANIPIMLITAKGSEYDVVSGLDAGADDYITKPFGVMELVSRVNALLRREARASAGVAGVATTAGVAGASEVAGAATSADPAEQDQGEKTAIARDLPLSFGPVELWPRKHRVFVAGEQVNLTLKEFDLLRFFFENPGLVFTREHLLEVLWGWEFSGNSRTVDVHIQTLRQKLGTAGALVETVRGVGYRLRESSGT